MNLDGHSNFEIVETMSMTVENSLRVHDNRDSSAFGRLEDETGVASVNAADGSLSLVLVILIVVITIIMTIVLVIGMLPLPL